MESQRMSLYMFTSCGWFFDDISGLEAAQVLKYASRAIDLVHEWTKKDLEKGLLDFLIQAKSNEPFYGHGGKVYEILVKPSRIGPSFAAAHYGLTSLMEEVPRETCPIDNMVKPLEHKDIKVQGMRITLGEVSVDEKRTGRKFGRSYLAMRGDGMDLSCLVGNTVKVDLDQAKEELGRDLQARPSKEHQMAIFSRYFPEAKSFLLKDLTPDTRKCIIDGLTGTIECFIKDYMKNHNMSLRQLIDLIQESGEQTPALLIDLSVQFFIDEFTSLLRTYNAESGPDWKELFRLVSFYETESKPATTKGQRNGVEWEDIKNNPVLKQVIEDFLRDQMDSLAQSNNNTFLENIINVLGLVRKMKMEPDLWECQNLFYDLYQDKDFASNLSPNMHAKFKEVGRLLGFVIGEE